MKPESAIESFHPLIQQWFSEEYPALTDAQRQAWPAIASGKNVLVTAPTGSGKTLTAFLWALNKLISGDSALGGTRVLYVSPLKALNNDIQRNLTTPLAHLRRVFEEAGNEFPTIRAQTRSGDTEPAMRQRMMRHPPEILITTPESLNLLLSSAGGRQSLLGIETVILDEIHAVFGGKRGTHLITAVERLAHLCGDFQRIALSATIKPLDIVAQFVGGFHADGSPRAIETIVAKDQRVYNLQVRYLAPPVDTGEADGFFIPLVEACKEIAERNRSTLFFVNSRRLCEKLTYKVNIGEKEPIAFAHHGSLSRDIRTEVERRLKAGELKAIIATSSLELGIDIGALDEVIMIQTPPSVAASIQRLGRAGHQVGASSSGTIYPLDLREIAEAVVLADAVPRGDLETVYPVELPLDVLAQQIISMTGTETWPIEDLFLQIKTSYPFRNLSRALFDSVLNMLAGKFADSRIRELQPRISIDGLEHTVKARKGALLALYSSGGVIPDRGYFQMRHDDNGARIGELDEEYVWEARIGHVLTLGTQSWKIRKITHNDVYVVPARADAGSPPFWKAEDGHRDYHLALRIGEFLQEAQHGLDAGNLQQQLQQRTTVDEATAETLARFLAKQVEDSHCDLPHANHMVIEHVHTGPGGAPGYQTILHTVWGGRVNQPFALALEAAWEQKFQQELRTSVSDYAVILVMSEPVPAEEIVSLIDETNIESLLRDRLTSSGVFGARFRECAAISLLIPRRKIGERLPLWISRLRAQKLLQAVQAYPDFPILLETWRTCLKDEFDLKHLQERLAELRRGALAWSEVQTATPSPFAHGDAWQQINEYMYLDDQRRSASPTLLSDELIADIIQDPRLRPGLSAELITSFEAKRQRLLPGYAPATADELLDWVKERGVIPPEEWARLLRLLPEYVLDECTNKLTTLKTDLTVAIERSDELQMSFFKESDEAAFARRFGEWLSFYGPIKPSSAAGLLGIPVERIDAFASGNQEVVNGTLVADNEAEFICDRRNYEILLRLARKAAAPQITAKPISTLPCFLATWQGLNESGDSLDDLRNVLETLICYPAKAPLWEKELLPARLHRYEPSWLDAICQERALHWVGHANETISFCFGTELDLIEAPAAPITEDTLFVDPHVGYEMATLQSRFAGTSRKLVDELWRRVWSGLITHDSYSALRQGIENTFKTPDQQRTITDARHRGRISRSGRARWESGTRYSGVWRKIPYQEENGNLLDQQERNRERVRILLDRYGILFRELLLREQSGFRWADIFRALRLMELSGELLSGYFFEDIPGPQFTTAKGLQVFQRRMGHRDIYWMNATDPVSPCGLDIATLKQTVPHRIASHHLVYRGEELIIDSRNHAKSLIIHLDADDPDLPQALGFMQHLLTRTFQPRRRLTIEKINGQPAAESLYIDTLKHGFEAVVEHRSITLHASIR